MNMGQRRSIESDYRVAKFALALLLLIPIGALALFVIMCAIAIATIHCSKEWLLRASVDQRVTAIAFIIGFILVTIAVCIIQHGLRQPYNHGIKSL